MVGGGVGMIQHRVTRIGGRVYVAGPLDDRLVRALQELDRDGARMTGRVWGGPPTELPPHTRFVAPAAVPAAASFRGSSDSDALLHLAGFGADDIEDTAAVLDAMRRELAARGLPPSAITRTWFFLADIGRDYARFNALRSETYRRWGLTVLPASTGIGADGGRTLSAELVCEPGWEPLQSPVQPDPMSYGVSFSRAAVVCRDGLRRLYVSGLAAIGADGQSNHPGDVTAQLQATLDAAAALLAQAGFGWTDTVEGTLYIKRAGDHAFAARELDRRWPGAPIITVVATVCRPELLCEIELLAAKEG